MGNPTPTPLQILRAYCGGRELQSDGTGALARFFRDAPVDGFNTIDDLRTACRHYGPNVAQSQIDTALVAAGLS